MDYDFGSALDHYLVGAGTVDYDGLFTDRQGWVALSFPTELEARLGNETLISMGFSTDLQEADRVVYVKEDPDFFSDEYIEENGL